MATSSEPSGRGDVVRVVLLAYQQVDELDLFGAYSVLIKAASVEGNGPSQPRLDVRIAARESLITGSGGVAFAVNDRLGVVELADAVVVPGGRGARNAAADPELLDVLRTIADRGAALYAICTGTFLIAAAGLARQRRVAVHHAKRDLLREYAVGEVTAGLVRDGQLRSVGGVQCTSVKSVDLAFQLLADFAPHTVSAVSARLEVSPSRGELVALAGGAA